MNAFEMALDFVQSALEEQLLQEGVVEFHEISESQDHCELAAGPWVVKWDDPVLKEIMSFDRHDAVLV